MHIKARSAKRYFIIGGDFNAEAGNYSEGDDAGTIGKYGFRDANSRGEWLQTWASSENLMIANTFFAKRPEHRCTFTTSSGVHKQLDYFLVDTSLRSYIHDATSSINPFEAHFEKEG